jgi:hypothetical chaperone protein
MSISHDLSIGIDFGTSNTVVAVADSQGHVEALTFDHAGESLKVYVTALCFWDERHGNGLRTRVEGGPWAIEQFLEGLHPVLQDICGRRDLSGNPHLPRPLPL